MNKEPTTISQNSQGLTTLSLTVGFMDLYLHVCAFVYIHLSEAHSTVAKLFVKQNRMCVTTSRYYSDGLGFWKDVS